MATATSAYHSKQPQGKERPTQKTAKKAHTSELSSAVSAGKARPPMATSSRVKPWIHASSHVSSRD